MSNKKIAEKIKNYQKKVRIAKDRRAIFSMFEKKMIYRTTKTENPETTMKMVVKTLQKLSSKK